MPVNPTTPLTRRNLLIAAPAVLLLPRLALADVAPTPRQTEGPFYPQTLPQDRDADLTDYDGAAPKGTVIEMAGQVFDLSSMPISGAVVEIWHCDDDGIYPHVGRNNGGLADPGFQGFGAVRTGPDGGYLFRTIRPATYQSRPRHIHVKVKRQGAPTLTTQMYFPEKDEKNRDRIFQGSSATLIAERVDGPPVRYVFDIYVT